MTLALSWLVALGLALALLSWFAQGRLLARPALRPRRTPPVSILKPLKGVDPGLARNLETFFALDYPAYELVFAIADHDDAAIPVVEDLIGRHPGFPARLVVSRRLVGVNPKVNNLALAEGAARHDLLLISDSNVRVEPGYLSELVAHHEAGAALVTSLIRGSGEQGAGGRLESLQLNTFVMGGVAAWATVFKQTCVVGKSMLLSRGALQDIGGWAFLGRFLAEDQVCGEEIAARGGRIALSGRPVDDRLGRLSVGDFCRRHLRWARIRRQISPAGYAAEALLNPAGVSLLAPALMPAPQAAGIIAAALAGMSLLALHAERRLGVFRPAWQVPLLEAGRAALVLALWPVPFVSSTVNWRGNRLRIGRRTQFVPLGSRSEREIALSETLLENSA